MSYPSYQNQYTRELQVGDKTITLTVGKYAEQTSGAVTARCGGTEVLATVALGRESSLDYFPLSVEYAEKLFAGGVIKGSRWVKRDGRPSDDAILRGRVIDRTLRPLFPEGMKHEVQVIITVFSTDKENEADMLGLLAASVALSISAVPFDGPVAGLRIGYRKNADQYLFNPTATERKELDMDLIVSGTGNAIVMVEAGANEVSEEVILTAFDKAQQEFGRLCGEIDAMVKEIGKPKADIVPSREKTPERTALEQEITKLYSKQVREMMLKEGRLEETGLKDLVKSITTQAAEKEAGAETPSLKTDAGVVSSIFHDLMKDDARRMIIEESVRPDDRKLTEIRPIHCEVDIFPNTHGSAMFKRGATQVLTITTLGSPSLGQLVEDMTGENTRHYIHHYNMPPFASGEAGRFGSPKRREIGHGALAERALMPMIPSQDVFPYTIQVVENLKKELDKNGYL
jgi:polyribonucleotide nucleotidyltransferase